MKTTLTSADPSGWYLCEAVKSKRNVARYWNGGLIATSLGQFCKLDYTNFRRLFTEDDVAALREELTALRDEVKRLKSHPYVMRQANEPDCEGLWRNCCGAIREWHETDLAGSNGCHYGPYHYIGPLPVIPVVVEQQPPKVVKVREKETGVTADAIVGNIKGLYTLLSLDGKACSVVSGDNWEEVQS